MTEHRKALTAAASSTPVAPKVATRATLRKPATRSAARLQRGPVAAAKAKAHFLQLLNEVEHDGKPIVITRRGKVVAHLIPPPEEKPVSNFDRVFGESRGLIKITGDIVSPDWESWGPEWR